MKLFVEQFEYLKSVSDAAGVRLVVHNQTSMPFPEDDGISISPGTKTSVGLRRVSVCSLYLNSYYAYFPTFRFFC